MKNINKYKYFNNIINIIIIISIIAIIIVGIILLNKKISSFENVIELDPTTTNFSELPSPPSVPPSTACSAQYGDVSEYCLDYNNCCKTSNEMNSCLCNHPSVKKCKADYDNCMNDINNIKNYTKDELSKMCISKNKQCCLDYNNIDIDSTIFSTNPINFNPKNNKICSLQDSGKMNLEQKCIELCQTYPDCAAYNLNTSSFGSFKCSLFSSIEKPNSDPITGKPVIDASYDYYIKKSKQ